MPKQPYIVRHRGRLYIRKDVKFAHIGVARSRKFIKICANNDTKMAIRTISHTINLKTVDNTGRTALMHACALGNIDIVNAILKMPRAHVGFTVRCDDGPLVRNALTYAIMSDSIECVKAIIKHEIRDQEHPIIFRSKSECCMEYLEVLARSPSGNTNTMKLARLLLKYANSKFFKCSCCGIRLYHNALVRNALKMPSCEFIDLLIDNLIDISIVRVIGQEYQFKLWVKPYGRYARIFKHVTTRGLRFHLIRPEPYDEFYKEWDAAPRSLKYCVQVLILMNRLDIGTYPLLMMPNSYRKELNFF